MIKQQSFLLCILCLTIICSMLIGCSAHEGYDAGGANVTKNGEYKLAAKSNMLKGLEFRRTVQSTQLINPTNQKGVQALSEQNNGVPPLASTQHINEQLYYWGDVTRAIKQVDGVATAYVFATNKNIYAAIMYSDDAHANNSKNEANHPSQPLVDNETNPIYRTVALLLSNYGAPREVFISSDHQFFHDLKPLVQTERKNRSLLPFVHDFNIIVQRYFEDRLEDSIPNQIDVKTIIF